jgi:hypothetical protein
MKKEQWSTHSFNNICWKRNETALKRISEARQAKAAKMWHNLQHNLRHTVIIINSLISNVTAPDELSVRLCPLVLNQNVAVCCVVVKSYS